MKLKIAAVLAFAALVAFLPTSTRADGLSFNLAGCPNGFGPPPCSGAVGDTPIYSYTSHGFTITATGYSAPHTFADLFIKTAGGDENGLGLEDQLHNEIHHGTFIQLNMSSLAVAGITSGMITLGSVQLREGYQICQSSAAEVPGITCFAGSLDGTPVAFSWSSTDPYVSITATTGDVLIANSITVPEPSSLILLGCGLLVLVGFTLKRAAA